MKVKLTEVIFNDLDGKAVKVSDWDDPELHKSIGNAIYRMSPNIDIARMAEKIHDMQEFETDNAGLELLTIVFKKIEETGVLTGFATINVINYLQSKKELEPPLTPPAKKVVRKFNNKKK